MAADSPDSQSGQRIDRFLWFARLAKTRSIAQTMCEQGFIRLDGRRIDRAHALVRPGNVLSLVAHGCVRVLRVEALPARRGPASEAATLYRELTPARPAETDD
ncbi:RNA-binding S4 domain-containing protein [Sphingomonas sp. LaA6.9]|uniref:RNA-binding S4 domain-containing protein n=1 Tax=Sphingomonas sp. LaA6.9 TaxID=2919914 RepID=UPI001F4F8950|nr:RNA-binding S4 domain-containing protein [Sphingomonas sp. LaA6.9]MCJ8158600.1 RNA-binding S4 domain-containing protein [Sphingomonas sp. LaA6.9]